MAHSETAPIGPDLKAGVPLSSVPATGILAGHVDGAPVLLSRQGEEIFAVGGECTHYGGALAEGLVSGDEVRCPLHHACFSLRTGRARKAPAFAALPAWRVEVIADRVFVREKFDEGARPRVPARPGVQPERIVLIGGGAAAFAAAERLRVLGFDGTLTMLSADDAPPCDRPNLSKDYLAGTASEDWIPLQPDEFYQERKIDLHLDCEVTAIDTKARQVQTKPGFGFAYDALLIATGAEPVRPATPWIDLPNVYSLRTLADCRAIIQASAGAKTAVLLGAGFISMEAAAALRTRGLEVQVIAREEVPMERVFGRELGSLLLRLHQDHGVKFHLKASLRDFDGKVLTLEDGTRIATDLLIVGIGVKPRTELAVAAGLAVQDGILVDERLRTSAAGVFAAGDVARYPHGVERLRIEHWVHAQRMGQAAAANMLGADAAFVDVPFFWTQHYDLSLRYTGHASEWDQASIDGSVPGRDCTVRLFRAGKLMAAASLGRDRENLEVEAELRS